jgi:NAD dependent epimerase/dehydratase family enzyme
MKIVLIGKTGLIGSKTVVILRRGGHEDVAGLARPAVQRGLEVTAG